MGGQMEGLEEAGRGTPKWTGICRKLRDVTDFLGMCISYLLLRNKQQPPLPAQLSTLKRQKSFILKLCCAGYFRVRDGSDIPHRQQKWQLWTGRARGGQSVGRLPVGRAECGAAAVDGQSVGWLPVDRQSVGRLPVGRAERGTAAWFFSRQVSLILSLSFCRRITKSHWIPGASESPVFPHENKNVF